MSDQLDLFYENKPKCQHCGRHPQPHHCWRCGGVVDCTADKLGGQRVSCDNRPGLAAIVGYGQRPGSCYECFDCNHAVAVEQLAWSWHRRKGIAFADALNRVRARLAVDA